MGKEGEEDNTLISIVASSKQLMKSNKNCEYEFKKMVNKYKFSHHLCITSKYQLSVDVFDKKIFKMFKLMKKRFKFGYLVFFANQYRHSFNKKKSLHNRFDHCHCLIWNPIVDSHEDFQKEIKELFPFDYLTTIDCKEALVSYIVDKNIYLLGDDWDVRYYRKNLLETA